MATPFQSSLIIIIILCSVLPRDLSVSSFLFDLFGFLHVVCFVCICIYLPNYYLFIH